MDCSHVALLSCSLTRLRQQTTINPGAGLLEAGLASGPGSRCGAHTLIRPVLPSSGAHKPANIAHKQVVWQALYLQTQSSSVWSVSLREHIANSALNTLRGGCFLLWGITNDMYVCLHLLVSLSTWHVYYLVFNSTFQSPGQAHVWLQWRSLATLCIRWNIFLPRFLTEINRQVENNDLSKYRWDFKSEPQPIHLK